VWATVVVGVGIVIFVIGIILADYGITVVGTPLIEAGSTLIGSGIIGLVIAKASATLSGEIQEGIDARKEHKRAIDQLVENLLTGASTTVPSTPMPITGQPVGLNFLGGYLVVGSTTLQNLQNISGDTEKKLLWEDIQNHWPKTSSATKKCLSDVAIHNRRVREFINSQNKIFKDKLTAFVSDPEISPATKSSESDTATIDNWFGYASGRLSAYSQYIMDPQLMRPGQADISDQDLKTLGMPASLNEFLSSVPTAQEIKLDEIPEEHRRILGVAPEELGQDVKVGKTELLSRYSIHLRASLQTVIMESVDELKQDKSLVSLSDRRKVLDSEVTKVDVALRKIELSKLLLGTCEYIKVG
jgi:hypothetical protein